MNIYISKPSTVTVHFFHPLPNFFELKDQAGNYYYFRHLNGRTPRITFNIPDAGNYTSENNFEVAKIEKIKTPLFYPTLPPAERNRFKQMKLVYEPGAHLANIDSKAGVVYYGNDFLQLPPVIQLFLLLHEQAHFFYLTEEYCDLYALIQYLKIGYNRSMAYYALTNYLSSTPENAKRIMKLMDNIQSTQINKI